MDDSHKDVTPFSKLGFIYNSNVEGEDEHGDRVLNSNSVCTVQML
jgi:hypothetical protein